MIPKEKDTIRFAVGEPKSPRSLIWRLWSLGDNVFIGTKNGQYLLKISLKDEDAWRIAYVRALNQNDSEEDTTVYKWNRPREFAPNFTNCLSIVIPTVRLSNPYLKNKAEDDRIIFIPESTDNKSIIFKILLGGPRAKKLDLGEVMKPEDKLFGSIKKQNGEKIWLIVKEDVLTKPQIDKVNKVVSERGINTMPSTEDETLDLNTAILIETEGSSTIGGQPTIFDIPLNNN